MHNNIIFRACSSLATIFFESNMSYTIGGYVLNSEELMAIQQIICDEKVIKQLMNEGLKLEGKITIEELQYYLKMLGMESEANLLKENLESFMKCKN